jgi:hypothetical protein
METKEKLDLIQDIVKTVDKLTPYMPPALSGTSYLFLHDDVLYMSTMTENTIYQDRLAQLLKEEFDFITEVHFLKKEKKNE